MKFGGNFFSKKDEDNSALNKEEKKKSKKDDEKPKKDSGDKFKKDDKHEKKNPPFSKKDDMDYETIRIQDVPPTDPIISGKKPETFVFYPTFTKKSLSIILIEDTLDVVNESQKILRFCKTRITTDLICVIRYGENFTETPFLSKFSFNDKNFFCTNNAGEKGCLSDVLIEVEKIVSDFYDKQKDIDSRKVTINKIDIIGFGTCKDNCSKTPKEEAAKAFSSVNKHAKVATKYFTLTDESMIDAAEYGFHSIASISKNYN